jgi:Fur family ferric uptake transcriptional regulator
MCGQVTEIKSQELTEVINSLHTKRFRKDGYSLYIYGICSNCQAKMTRKAKLEEKKKLQKNKKEK